MEHELNTTFDPDNNPPQAEVVSWGNVTQFVPPNGRRVDVPFPLESHDVALAYEHVTKAGITLELERLSMGTWSLTLSDRLAEDDYVIEFVKEGPADREAVKEKFYQMIGNFDPSKHAEWRALHMDDFEDITDAVYNSIEDKMSEG